MAKIETSTQEPILPTPQGDVPGWEAGDFLMSRGEGAPRVRTTALLCGPLAVHPTTNETDPQDLWCVSAVSCGEWIHKVQGDEDAVKIAELMIRLMGSEFLWSIRPADAFWFKRLPEPVKNWMREVRDKMVYREYQG